MHWLHYEVAQLLSSTTEGTTTILLYVCQDDSNISGSARNDDEEAHKEFQIEFVEKPSITETSPANKLVRLGQDSVIGIQ